MTLSFVKYGVDDIEKDISLSECLSLGLNDFEEVNHDGRLWASQVSHCPRKGALEATIKERRSFNASNKMYCEIGNTVESLILKGWEERNRLLFSQYKLPDIREFKDLNLGGYIDAIALQGTKIRSVEIKTCGALPLKPRQDQESQALLYSAFTGFPATLLYFSREVADWNGSLKVQQFDYQFDEEELRHYMFNAVYARVCIRDGIIPDKSTKINVKSHCFYCNFIDYCWDESFDEKVMLKRHRLSQPTITENIKATEEALKITDKVMSPENIISRKNGILKHLSRFGTKAAKELLSGTTWSDNI